MKEKTMPKMIKKKTMNNKVKKFNKIFKKINKIK